MVRVDGGSSCIWQQRRLLPVLPKHMVRWQLFNPHVECLFPGRPLHQQQYSKLRKLAGKAHPNIYEAVTLFKSEQAATEVSCSWLQADCQPGGGGNTDFMRKDWQQSKRSMRQVTTPSVNFSKLTAIGCHFDCMCKL